MAQDWGANPKKARIYYNVATEAYTEVPVVFQIKDALNPNGIYEYFYIGWAIQGWLSTTGASGFPAMQESWENETGNLNIRLYTGDGISIGNYQKDLKFVITAKITNGGLFTYSQWNYPVELVAYDPTGTTPVLVDNNTPIHLNHYLGEALQNPIDYTVKAIDGLDWELVFRNDIFNIVCTDASTTTTTNGTTTTISGNAEAIVQIKLSDTWLAITDPTVVSKFFTINYESSISIQQEVIITLVAYNGFDFSPHSFIFEAVKDVFEADLQKLIIESQEQTTITNIPAWLEVTPLVGQYHQEIILQPIGNTNTAIGIHTATLHAERTVAGNTVITEIPVLYHLYDLVNTPYLTDGFNFTLDKKFISFFSNNVDVYFQIKMTVLVYDFFTKQETQHELDYKVPLFQNKQQMNIGLVVDRLMKNLEEYNDQSQAQYKLADVSLYMAETMRATDTVVRERYVQNLKFVAGLTPPLMENDMAFLDVNSGNVRVTPKSFFFINLLLKIGLYTLKFYKNETHLGDYPIQAGLDNIFTKKINFSMCEAGDTFIVKLEDEANHSIQKKYLVLPEGKESNHIVWLDEYKLKRALEFTGSYFISQDIQNIFSNKYQGLLQALEKIDSSKVAKLTINTGWLTKSDQISITSLLSQKKAWLIFENGTRLDLVPTTQKIKSVDSERALISFSITFTINFKDNAQAYTF